MTAGDLHRIAREKVMPPSLVVGVDVSTNSAKAIAWNHQGNAVAEGRASYPLMQPHPNWYEQDAEAWWDGVWMNIALSAIPNALGVALGMMDEREYCANRKTY